ncbi:SIS domain-containing protein [Rhodospirillum rubrum]|uniref:Hexulose-6-phosphate isomerase n=1 Tax=Rhodospirillum rubrum (strain ATCC 11170 / ATH 1.1.1 / DSM 467 / LMG 4362 / NCIMB 8255 / S1) TaxID=269796 RepID=Q2RUM7_RHORT|nr:SIS domain-containing protein [Rhodospirillum rubrum]ABC22168.1 hexulose-6-phosphate isomerase [Rhodospirillum rubrum ATCC 11170]AEO47882.1 hexulose-6-phosphate isomerase [Rhodospirillum rubrum F11]MBK5953756.1 hexulose-6-phosphate isomerase [Rhodospirillum rubrum]QXG81816.1 SIS domain-containing protein [Rhodospirillum rubrum]HAP98968.1 hexulose-6-phosphate isomerase [Rhodospirillum rubrum]
MGLKATCLAALDDLRAVFATLDETATDRAVEEFVKARQIALYGVGREGLQIKGLAMRLHHLGLRVAMVGDMTTPPLAAGDLLVVSAGPGAFSTVSALMGVAKAAGARSLLVTAQPAGDCARLADVVLPIPAQTMADDQHPSASILPMGSVFEGAEFILFEALVLALRDRLAVSPEAMRARHTNLE